MCTKSRDVMEGASKGLSPLLKIIKDLRSTEPASLNMFFRLDKFQLCIYQRRERKEECYNPVLAFSFYLYFHIRSSNKGISFVNAKTGMVEGEVHIFLTKHPPCSSFRTTPLAKRYRSTCHTEV